MDKAILEKLEKDHVIDDSRQLAKSFLVDHQEVVGSLKSLQSAGDLIVCSEKSEEKWILTAEGNKCLQNGSLEAQLFAHLPADGATLEEVKSSFPDFAVAFGKASSKKWLKLDKSSGKVLKITDSIIDDVRLNLEKLSIGDLVPPKTLDDYKKRKLVEKRLEKFYRVEKGENFSLETKKLATDLTSDMLASGTWKDETFKKYNFAAKGVIPDSGHLHPLMKVRSEFRNIFLEMGFTEMPTNNFVESSFWNFDALFQPQQHPARDAQDTFFVSQPAVCDKSKIPADYLEAVSTKFDVYPFGF